MGKSKARRPAPAPATQEPAALAPPALTAPGPVRFPWTRLALGVLTIVLLLGIWWCGVRPWLMIRDARAIFETDPAAAAGLIEDAVASSLTRQRDAEVLWTRALVRTGQKDEALGCFGMIQSPELTQPQELLELANDAMQARLPLLAVLALKAIPTTSSRRSDAVERMIVIEQMHGRGEAALALAKEWAQLQPQNAVPWRIQAQIYEQQLRFTEAKQCYRDFLSREKNSELRLEGQRSLINLLIVLGEREEARGLQNELAQTEATLTTVDQLHEAQLRRLEGDIAGAWNEVGKVLQAEPVHLVAIELRGTLAMSRLDYRSAESDFEAVLKEQPWNKAVHYKLGQSLAKLGREAESATHFAENRRLNDLSTRILELQGRTDRTSGETAELILALEQTGLKAAAERLKPSQQ